MQYGIDNDPLNLTFQWDSNFGITVTVPHTSDILVTENVIKDLCDKMNRKKSKQKKLTDT
jgi:hypothetical protein